MHRHTERERERERKRERKREREGSERIFYFKRAFPNTQGCSL